MYQSSEAFGNLVLQDSRNFKSLITYDDVSITNAKSIKFTGGAEGEDDFSLGSTVSQYVTITIPDPGRPIEGHEVLVQIGMEINGLVEYIPMGYFTPGKPSRNEEQIEFTAYDRMMKTERPFSMNGDNTDSVSVLKRIQEITGVMVMTDGISAINMKVPKGYSCREALSYVAQLHGCFAVCNRNGQIELHQYVDSSYTVSTGRYWDTFEHNDYLFRVEKLTCYTGQDEEGKDISISSGVGTRAVTFSNPFMTQDILDNVLEKLNGFSYMPGSLRMLGDPRLDPWDVLTVEDRKGSSYKVPLMKLEWEYDGGFTDSVEAVGLSEEETNEGYKGPTTKEMERYYAQLVMIDHAMINKLDVDTAKITYATIQNLTAVNASVQKLDVEVGDFKQLTATDFAAVNAKIDILESDYGNIKTLLSGTAGIGDLQNIHLTSKNAVIDSALIKTAVMQTVTIADLMAGTISTDKFIIASDDGGIRIHGATQQWSDSDGIVRMQAGRDGNGDFTFSLFDKTGKGILIDAAGIKPDAIADGTIIDSKVGDTANINAKKLNINSIFSVINGSNQTIKSSRIWVDEKNQTLNQIFSALESDAAETKTQVATIRTGLNGLQATFSQTDSNNQGKFQALTTSLSVIQGNISALISDSELEELKNGSVTMYSRLASVEMNTDSLQLSFSDMNSKYDTVNEQYTLLVGKTAEYKVSLDELSVSLSGVSARLEKDYSTTTQMNSAISQKMDSIIATVSSTYATKTELGSTDSKVEVLETWKKEASLKITDSAIISTVTASADWGNKADKANIISQINQSSERISISASKINLNGLVTANSYFKILTDGSMQATSGKIGGWSIKATTIVSEDGSLILDAKNNKICTGTTSSYIGTEITKDSVTTNSVTCAQVDCTYGNFGDGGNYLAISDGFSGSGKATLCINGKFLANNSAVKLYALSHVTSGGHIVFASDGATLAYLSSSSRRYKNHIRDLKDSDIEGLFKIPTVYFTYKPGYLEEDSDIPIPGLYAEDVEQYLPFAARYQDGKIEDWNERAVIPYLIKAVQECHRTITELKRKVG